MNLIKSAINHPTAVLLFFLAMLVTGFMSLYRLPLELTRRRVSAQEFIPGKAEEK
ncbi:MAG: hypothetical protein MUC94_14265 [bacterium]|nr:hypothetical protein [bacterium]